jgi:hypothetical protein
MPEVDFRYYWLAGHMWAQGLDPYSAQFSALGRRVLPPGSSWLYPPAWWPIARALAEFDFPTALNLWRAAVPIILSASTAAVVAILSRGAATTDRALFIGAACAVAVAMEPTGIVLTGGQVSPIIFYAGLALVTCATLAGRPSFLVAGLVLAALKPQVGIVLFLAFAFAPAHRRAVSIALLVLLALSLPQFLRFGLQTTIIEMLDNMHAWSRLPGNATLGTTGIMHLLARVGLSWPSVVAYVPAAACACAAGFLFTRDRHSLDALALVLAGIAAFVPLHNYDMTFLSLLAVILIAANKSVASRVIIGCALAFTLRPIRIEALFGVPIYSAVSGGNVTYSLASLVLLAIAVRGALTADAVPAVAFARDRAGFRARVMGRSTKR